MVCSQHDAEQIPSDGASADALDDDPERTQTAALEGLPTRPDNAWDRDSSDEAHSETVPLKGLLMQREEDQAFKGFAQLHAHFVWHRESAWEAAGMTTFVANPWARHRAGSEELNEATMVASPAGYHRLVMTPLSSVGRAVAMVGTTEFTHGIFGAFLVFPGNGSMTPLAARLEWAVLARPPFNKGSGHRHLFLAPPTVTAWHFAQQLVEGEGYAYRAYFDDRRRATDAPAPIQRDELLYWREGGHLPLASRTRLGLGDPRAPRPGPLDRGRRS